MAALTINTNDAGKAVRFLEAITDTNEAASVDKYRAVKVPGWAKAVSFYLYVDSTGGTTPLIDLLFWVPDFGTAARLSAPDDTNMGKLADFAGITQVTGAGPYQQTIDIGPGVTGIADDATGSATADARMAINTYLPPWLVYELKLDGTTHDEDYTVRLVCKFHGEG